MTHVTVASLPTCGDRPNQHHDERDDNCFLLDVERAVTTSHDKRRSRRLTTTSTSTSVQSEQCTDFVQMRLRERRGREGEVTNFREEGRKKGRGVRGRGGAGRVSNQVVSITRWPKSRAPAGFVFQPCIQNIVPGLSPTPEHGVTALARILST